MATRKNYEVVVVRALRAAGLYTKELRIQIDNLARTLYSLDKCDEVMDDPDFSPIVAKVTRDGEQPIEHPVFKIQARLLDKVDKQMKQLGLTVDNLIGKPDLPDAIDELSDELDRIE